MSVSYEYCVLSGIGLCDWPIPRPEESYRLWCVSECDRESSIMRGPWRTGGRCGTGEGAVVPNEYGNETLFFVKPNYLWSWF
jgi:hypothetical protein